VLLALKGLWALIPKWLLAALLVGALGQSCVMSVQRDAARSEVTQTNAKLDRERADREKERADRATVARDAEAEYRRIENRRVSMAQEISNDLSRAQAARAMARERERADHDRMRGDVDAFLAAGRGGSAETCPAELAAERDRAATLGDLYLEADRQAGEFADAAERHADEARALKRQLLEDRR
jgi:hypothetical protein